MFAILQQFSLQPRRLLLEELGAPFDCPPYPYTLKFVEDEREKTMKGNTPTV